MHLQHVSYCLALLFALGLPLVLQAQSSPGIPRYTVAEALADKKPQPRINAAVRGIDVVPYIIAGEDSLQSYIQDNAISVWVNLPSLDKNGDTLTAVVKRVLRYDITHALNANLVAVDVLKFNTRNDTFARVASLDTTTNTLTPNTKQEWEKTSLDLDMTALYHYVGYLYENKHKK
jgi:hypothetical protein